jgi:hypothetical protein
MTDKPISEEDVFAAGYRYASGNGQVGRLTKSEIEGNAKAAYQDWLRERQKTRAKE